MSGDAVLNILIAGLVVANSVNAYVIGYHRGRVAGKRAVLQAFNNKGVPDAMLAAREEGR